MIDHVLAMGLGLGRASTSRDQTQSRETHGMATSSRGGLTAGPAWHEKYLPVRASQDRYPDGYLPPDGRQLPRKRPKSSGSGPAGAGRHAMPAVLRAGKHGWRAGSVAAGRPRQARAARSEAGRQTRLAGRQQ